MKEMLSYTLPVLLSSSFQKYFHRRIPCAPIWRNIFQVSSFHLTETEQRMGNRAVHHMRTSAPWPLRESFTPRENSGMSHAFHFCTLYVICILESTLFRLYQRFWITPGGILSYCLSLHTISGKVCTAKETPCEHNPGFGDHEARDRITD